MNGGSIMVNARNYFVLAGIFFLALTSLAQQKTDPDQSAAKSPKPDPAVVTLRQQLTNEMQQKVRDEVQQLRQELRQDLRQQVKMDLKQELRQELKQELRMELKMELMQELRSR